VTNYTEDALPPLGTIIRYIWVDWIIILLVSTGIGIVLFDLIRRWGIPETVREPKFEQPLKI
jgi:hypothetical protein